MHNLIKQLKKTLWLRTTSQFPLSLLSSHPSFGSWDISWRKRTWIPVRRLVESVRASTTFFLHFRVYSQCRLVEYPTSGFLKIPIVSVCLRSWTSAFSLKFHTFLNFQIKFKRTFARLPIFSPAVYPVRTRVCQKKKNLQIKRLRNNMWKEICNNISQILMFWFWSINYKMQEWISFTFTRREILYAIPTNFINEDAQARARSSSMLKRSFLCLWTRRSRITRETR